MYPLSILIFNCDLMSDRHLKARAKWMKILKRLNNINRAVKGIWEKGYVIGSLLKRFFE